MNNLQSRLAKLEEQITPAAEPIVIDVVFVDAATKQETRGFRVTGFRPSHRRQKTRSR
jgi:hypothetical protein